MRQKHPHACGEDSSSLGDTGILSGNTPTHVGKTRECSAAISFGLETPPRMWGRPTLGNARQQVIEETPPRMWGRQSHPANLDPEIRNTPTHVGKTLRHYTNLLRTRKHPHACGEDKLECRKDAPAMGNTPTHVGKTEIKPR